MKWLGRYSMRVPWVGHAGQISLIDLFTFKQPAWVYFLDFAIYPLLILACAWQAAHDGVSVLAMAWLAGAGVLAWTLAEYVLHRAVFHHAPVIRGGHLAHHAAPRELVGTPVLISAGIFLLAVFAPLVWAVGQGVAAGLSVGLLTGYLAYIGVHHLVHHGSSHGIAHLARLKRHHALHHHGGMDCNFGVTTRLWDWIFGTLR